MNLYATPDAVKSVLEITTTAHDAAFLVHLEDASRRIDAFCNRRFYTEQATRYFAGRCGSVVWVDDFLTLTAFGADSELDGTFDGESWVEGTDWTPRPHNSWPKIGIMATAWGNYALTKAEYYLRLTGTWGYGDGLRQSPWDAKAVTGTVATTTGTTLTLSADDIVQAGHTLLIGTEQLYVEAVATGTATVQRGVNGTTAAAHSTAAVSIASYPAAVEKAVVHLAIGLGARAKHAGFESERIGEYQYKLAGEASETQFLGRALNGLVRFTP